MAKIVSCLVLSLLFTICLPPSVYSAESARIRSLIARMGYEATGDRDVPGISIAVMQQGDIEPIVASAGVACIENLTPMTSESIIKIGSVTKLFTATLVHDLIQRGKLSYETKIERFFPLFPHARDITVWNLLTHTSGIVDMLHLEPVYSNMAKYWSPAELIAMAGAQPLEFSPGTDQRYSNTGYLMLGVICEILRKKKYNQQVEELFIEELGMKTLLAGEDTAIVKHQSCGYSCRSDNKLCLPIVASIAIAQGTGNLEAAPASVAKLVNLKQVIKKNVLDTIPLKPLTLDNGKTVMSPLAEGGYKTSYLDGCTLFMFDKPQITLVGKLGSFPGFGTAYFYDQQTKIAIAVSVNNEKAITKAILLGANVLYKLRSL